MLNLTSISLTEPSKNWKHRYRISARSSPRRLIIATSPPRLPLVAACRISASSPPIASCLHSASPPLCTHLSPLPALCFPPMCTHYTALFALNYTPWVRSFFPLVCTLRCPPLSTQRPPYTSPPHPLSPLSISVDPLAPSLPHFPPSFTSFAPSNPIIPFPPSHHFSSSPQVPTFFCPWYPSLPPLVSLISHPGSPPWSPHLPSRFPCCLSAVYPKHPTYSSVLAVSVSLMLVPSCPPLSPLSSSLPPVLLSPPCPPLSPLSLAPSPPLSSTFFNCLLPPSPLLSPLSSSLPRCPLLRLLLLPPPCRVMAWPYRLLTACPILPKSPSVARAHSPRKSMLTPLQRGGTLPSRHPR
ncbi:unnamed protein product [Closterium sp. NIES-65]|nr:unnamed protein product [Closterium sp. NIES-65]